MNPRNPASVKPKLQKDMVVDKAIATADREGLEAVTIRRLAQELGVSPMALYWHFADKDALFRAISERLWEDVAFEIETAGRPEGDSWAELTLMTECLLAVLRRHPGCARLAPRAVLACRPGLDITERALELLAAQGVAADRSADLAHFLLSTCITLVSTQPGGQVPGPQEESEIRARKAALVSLPADRYPRLIAAAPFMVDCPDAQVYYRRGIDFLIGGIRHEASAARPAGNGGARAKGRRTATPSPTR